MTLKNPAAITDPSLGDALTKVYAVKLESRFKRTTSGVETFVYQACEHGEVNFSANGSADVVQTYALAERHGKIVYAAAHARNAQAIAAVTDVTNTSITIACVSRTGTGNFSSVITATVKVFYEVKGSSP